MKFVVHVSMGVPKLLLYQCVGVAGKRAQSGYENNEAFILSLENL